MISMRAFLCGMADDSFIFPWVNSEGVLGFCFGLRESPLYWRR
jgi:hypothetical protein